MVYEDAEQQTGSLYMPHLLRLFPTTGVQSNIAQWKSDGLITRRSLDRHQVLLSFLDFCDLLRVW